MLDPASIGLRVKTGRAVAVVLGGTTKHPIVLLRGELVIGNSAVPDTWQPYHVVMDLPWTEAEAAVKKNARLIHTAAKKQLTSWSRETQGFNRELKSVGIVVGSLQDPARIGNPHIRAHAAEGRLFRVSLERAADQLGLPRLGYIEDSLFKEVAGEIGLSETELKKRVTALGDQIGRPWRADEKAAAAAAWAALAAVHGGVL
jgi:hypothetical protein